MHTNGPLGALPSPVRLMVTVLLSTALSPFSARAATSEVTVSGVEVRQRWPWNGLVDITYNVTVAPEDPAAEIHVFFCGIDRDAEKTVPMLALSGAGAEGPVNPGTHTLVWNAAADYPDFNSTRFAVKVQAVAGETLYLEVDLSGGSEAATYPVATRARLPDPIPDDYKTSKLILRYVPPGTYLMGSPEEEFGRGPYENQHPAILTDAFYLGVFEVTQEQWELVMGNNPSAKTGNTRPVESVSYEDIRGSVEGAGWPSHDRVDPDSFLGRLRSKTGLMVDLPTEMQWEYACRAGTTRAYANPAANGGRGSDCLTLGTGRDKNLDPVAVYTANQEDGHAAVGSRQPNRWGLFDMHGNVHEWCLDWWADDLGADPLTDFPGPGTGTARAARGGAWNSKAADCRSANRYFSTPTNRFYGIGLRLRVSP